MALGIFFCSSLCPTVMASLSVAVFMPGLKVMSSARAVSVNAIRESVDGEHGRGQKGEAGIRPCALLHLLSIFGPEVVVICCIGDVERAGWDASH
jgi:hypothetical protein